MPNNVSFGFGSIFNGINVTNKNFASNIATALNNLIIAVRVKSIVLDASHPRFQEVGGWNGIGTIEYDLVSTPNLFPNNVWPLARPVSSNTKVLPLINEIVYVIALPNTGIGETTTSKLSYYISTVSIWNHPHHNGYPVNSNIPPPSQQKDYDQSTLGSVRRVTDQSTEINLGNTFIERSNIHPLLPFEGDVIQEGRWGNSIRFGSTVKTKELPSIGLNDWSQGQSTPGDPITIIRNGQPLNANPKGWLPIIENINTDLSSIYLTSTQTIPLNASSISYFSYPSNPPQDINKFNGPQLMYNSGRIVLNTNQDHLLLSSIKSINLNAVESVNIDTPTTIIQSSKVLLGSKNAVQPVLLGNNTVATLNSILNNLNEFLQVCSVIQIPSAPGALTPLNTAADSLYSALIKIKGNLEKLKSNTVKTV
jgi:hypothetical protein